MTVGKYAKLIVAAVAALGTAGVAASSDDMVTATEAVQVALAVLTALGVYVVPNAEDKTP